MQFPAVHFARACAADELAEGEGRLVVLHGLEVQLFRIKGEVHALDNVCPHAGAPINCALWNGETVTCTYHGLRFGVPGGACPDAPGWELDRFATREDDRGVFVGLPFSPP